MIRVWKQLIRPLAEAIEARQVLEIGSEAGLSTRVILNYLRGVGGHLHSVDTHPGFDTQAVERDYPGAVTFYQALSLDALQHIPPVDLALVDGDHNWYTVYHELLLLEQRHAQSPLQPLILVHDSGWPYGRRDLYYDPDTVPAEYRHDYARRGIPLPGDVLATGDGMNAHMLHALEEGGPRNGVLTAIEDFLAASDKQWELLQLPMYYGLSILVPGDRAGTQAPLQAQVAKLREQLRGEELIALAERLRLAEGVQFQKLHRQLEEARARIRELEEQLAGGNAA